MWRRCWILLPMLASLASNCEDASRGAAPTSLTTVEIVLESRLAAGPAVGPAVEACLARLGGAGKHVRPSWRDNYFTAEFDPARVPLVRTAPSRFAASFNDVPASTQLTLTVHDENECVRRPVIPGTLDEPGRLAERPRDHRHLRQRHAAHQGCRQRCAAAAGRDGRRRLAIGSPP